MWKYTWHKNCIFFLACTRHSICHLFWHSLWHLFWLSLWQSIWHIFRHSFWHPPDIPTFYLAWHSTWHSSLTFSLTLTLLRARCWSPAVAGHASWARDGTSPAVPTEIWSWQLRSGGKEEGRKEGRTDGRTEGRKEGKEGRKERRKENATLIKSRNRQLAGGEILYENNVQKILVEFPGIQTIQAGHFWTRVAAMRCPTYEFTGAWGACRP